MRENAFPATPSADDSPLTKREIFAALAMQGLLSSPDYQGAACTAIDAVVQADALIEALKRPAH